MKKFLILFIAVIVFAGCQEKKETPANDTSGIKKETTIKKEGLHITDAWVRPAAKSRNTGVFFNITNNTGDSISLMEARTDIAEKTEIHETFRKSNDMMGMREVEYVVIKEGETFQFKPMHHHVMLINLKEDLTEENEVELTLVFSTGEEIKIKAVVKDNMPSIKAGDEKQKEM